MLKHHVNVGIFSRARELPGDAAIQRTHDAPYFDANQDLRSRLMAQEDKRQQVQEKTFVFQQDQISVTISVGAAVLTEEDRNAGELLKRADERLYEAKNSGRNRVCA